jgi:large conductance mechanosensitive channel
MVEDFKAFVARGNVLDLAIGVIIGAAFGKVIATFTEGIIMPIVGMLFGGADFKAKVFSLGKMPVTTADEVAKAIAAKEPLIMYGQLFSDILNFLIVALIMFLIARAAMGYFAKLAADTPPPAEETLLTEIRDILAKK